MMVVGKKIEELIARLAQKARAPASTWMNTQRPSVDVITGLIKANIPTRLVPGVEQDRQPHHPRPDGRRGLLGQGDMFYLTPGGGHPGARARRLRRDDEVHRVVEYLKSQGEPELHRGHPRGRTLEARAAMHGDGEGGAGLTARATRCTTRPWPSCCSTAASISLVQRHLRIGYNRSRGCWNKWRKSGLVGGDVHQRQPGHHRPGTATK